MNKIRELFHAFLYSDYILLLLCSSDKRSWAKSIQIQNKIESSQQLNTAWQMKSHLRNGFKKKNLATEHVASELVSTSKKRDHVRLKRQLIFTQNRYNPEVSEWPLGMDMGLAHQPNLPQTGTWLVICEPNPYHPTGFPTDLPGGFGRFVQFVLAQQQFAWWQSLEKASKETKLCQRLTSKLRRHWNVRQSPCLSSMHAAP